MSAKPTTLPRWATTASALIVVPPSAKQDIGDLTSEKPPAQYTNWIRNLSYQWLSYLNSLLTTGGGATDNIDTSGNANFGGTFAAGGNSTIGGNLTLANAKNLVLQTTGQVQIASAGDLKHAGDWAMPFSFAGWVLESGTATFASDGFGATAAVTAALDLYGLRNGDVITSVDFGIAESTASWTYMLCRKPTTAAGGTTTIATGTINSGTANITTRTLAAINHTVDATFAYFLKITTTSGAGITTGGTVHVTH